MLSPANTQSTSTREYVEPEEYKILENGHTNQVVQLHGVTFKKRAPRAIKEIKAFATKSMVRTIRLRILEDGSGDGNANSILFRAHLMFVSILN
jgi:hypothetical protein